MASQITSLTIVYSTVYSGTDQRKHQSSASLAFVQGSHRWPVNSPHKWRVMRKMFPFDDIMYVKFLFDNFGFCQMFNTFHKHCSSIPLRAISPEVLFNFICNLYSEITLLKILPHPPGVKGLTDYIYIVFKFASVLIMDPVAITVYVFVHGKYKHWSKQHFAKICLYLPCQSHYTDSTLIKKKKWIIYHIRVILMSICIWHLAP